MKIDACISKITKYLASENAQPLLVNVHNSNDLDSLITHFEVDGNSIVDAAKFCNKDELPRIEMLLDSISSKKENFFLVGLTSFLRFYGEEEIKKQLTSMINMNILGHVVLITYQCEKHLTFSDPRLSRNICMIDGDETPLPKLVFMAKEIQISSIGCIVNGIENVVKKIENSNEDKIYIITAKNKDMYEKSIYAISNMHDAYEVLMEKDPLLSLLEKNVGTSNQWNYLLTIINSGKSFPEICNTEFGNHQSLEISIPSYGSFSENKKWLYFIALKLFGAKNNNCLNIAANNATLPSQLIREVFRSILEKKSIDRNFNEFYEQRKSLLIALGNQTNEVVDFCKVVLQKEAQAIYYLTDNSRQEKELIIRLLEKYYQNTKKSEIEKILNVVYPDLYAYIQDYRYNLPLLDKYFPMYTHSKIINKIIPELEELVTQQAVLREYNLLLEPRTAKIDEIDKNGSQLYFIDAMGVEYLSYIFAKCKEKGLMANATICCANLPSITSKNKEFITAFETKGLAVNSIKELDEIKHHGINDYDYRQIQQPIHIIRELEIIDEALENIKLRLSQGCCEKAIIMSDHGASRLAVIHETENMWEMASNGKHSGRCCPKSDADVQSEFATEEDGFWVLANYDRFKGGRKANVEVHGGATLEEVVVPIIEIVKFVKNIEVSIVDKIITVSFRKQATIRIFSNTKLHNVTVLIDGKYYEAQEQDDNMYLVNMPQLKKAKKYSADVFSSNNLVAANLSFEIKKESSQEKDLL
ncbi:MAG: BREX-4 system phosphatase PglZ [Oscillospiraceae bacterium]